MKIYTGTCGGNTKLLDKIKSLDMGMCVSSEVQKFYNEVPIFIDNGAFEAWRRGMPWSKLRFYDLLERCWKNGINADFIVCPDIVAGGLKSLEHSMKWADNLQPARLALAVQDGMTISNVDRNDLSQFTHIFVGGSVEWKWKTAEEWVKYAHSKGLKCHIGRCGTLERLRYAKKIGADSVDSTSWIRNKSWYIVEEFLRPLQINLIEEIEK